MILLRDDRVRTSGGQIFQADAYCSTNILLCIYDAVHRDRSTTQSMKKAFEVRANLGPDEAVELAMMLLSCAVKARQQAEKTA